MATFVQNIKDRTPPVLQAYWGERFMGVLALTVDMTAEALRHAFYSMLPGATPGPAYDSTEYLGHEFSLPRYATETWLQYTARIENAPETWTRAGKEETIEKQLELAGFPGAEVKTPLDWPHSFNTWSEFFVYFPYGSGHTVISPAPIINSAGPLVVGGFNISGGLNIGDSVGGVWSIGDGTIVGPIGISPEELSSIRSIINKWRPAHHIPVQIIWELGDGWVVGTGHEVGEPLLTIGGETAVAGVI